MKKRLSILCCYVFVFLCINLTNAQTDYNNTLQIHYTISNYADWQTTPRSLGLSYQRNIGKYAFLKAELGEYSGTLSYDFYQKFGNTLGLKSFSFPFFFSKAKDGNIYPNIPIFRTYTYTNLLAGGSLKFKNRHQIQLGIGVSYREGEETFRDYTIDFGNWSEDVLHSELVSEWGYNAECSYQFRVYKGINIGCATGYKRFERSINDWYYNFSLGYTFGR